MRQQAKGAKPIEDREEMEPTRKLFLQQKPTLLISCLKPSSGFPFQPEQDPDSSVSTVILSSLIFLHATLLRGPSHPRIPFPSEGAGSDCFPQLFPSCPNQHLASTQTSAFPRGLLELHVNCFISLPNQSGSNIRFNFHMFKYVPLQEEST